MRRGRTWLMAGVMLFVLTACIDTLWGVDVLWLRHVHSPAEREAARAWWVPSDGAAALYGTPVPGGAERLLLFDRSGLIEPVDPRGTVPESMVPEGVAPEGAVFEGARTAGTSREDAPAEPSGVRWMVLPADGVRPWPMRRVWLLAGAWGALLIVVGLWRGRRRGGQSLSGLQPRA